MYEVRKSIEMRYNLLRHGISARSEKEYLGG
jgi:hypothetical protein